MRIVITALVLLVTIALAQDSNAALNVAYSDQMAEHLGATPITCPADIDLNEIGDGRCYQLPNHYDSALFAQTWDHYSAQEALRAPMPIEPWVERERGATRFYTFTRIFTFPIEFFGVLFKSDDNILVTFWATEPEVNEELDDAVPEGESLHEDTLEPDNFPTSSFESYEVQRQRPIVVVLYNSDPVVGRQAGLLEATTIYEFPSAYLLTQLVAVFDSVDPGRIGPIAPLQDYQYFIAEDLNGVIVHKGGQSVALDAVAQGRVPSFDAHEDRFRELYNRYQGASAPYNLYSDGAKLRDFLQVYDRDEARSVQGVAYRPIPELPEAGVLEVYYAGGYASGFHYIPELGLYRWHRSGVPATDADGEAVVTQAIVIAHIEAVSVMGDSEDRLKLAIDEGGEATLFLGGKVIAGRWQREDGFQSAKRIHYLW